MSLSIEEELACRNLSIITYSRLMTHRKIQRQHQCSEMHGILFFTSVLFPAIYYSVSSEKTLQGFSIILVLEFGPI